MDHLPAIKCIQSRITKIQDQISKAKSIMDNPEMHADYYYAKIDVDNFNQEIKSLNNTISYLIGK